MRRRPELADPVPHRRLVDRTSDRLAFYLHGPPEFLAGACRRAIPRHLFGLRPVSAKKVEI
ncbi:hypothetical protein Ae168Ps1_2056c [Pseudonocardia sp. Ae168_Ps1]|nr:hypothetical protein Ae168Ps1_2056c [Pseudonocardia sp. Ae168_Ps1]